MIWQGLRGSNIDFTNCIGKEANCTGYGFLFSQCVIMIISINIGLKLGSGEDK